MQSRAVRRSGTNAIRSGGLAARRRTLVDADETPIWHNAGASGWSASPSRAGRDADVPAAALYQSPFCGSVDVGIFRFERRGASPVSWSWRPRRAPEIGPFRLLHETL